MRVRRGRRATGPRETVKIDAKTYDLLWQYSDKTGVSITRTITEAVNDWMETVGRQRLEMIGESLRRRENELNELR
jgi:hypothetical protein